MADIIDLGSRVHVASASKQSGRIFSRGMPVSFSIWKTRIKGTPRSAQRVTVDLSTEHLRAKSECRSPFSASSKVRNFVIGEESCTTNNASQGAELRKTLTTEDEGTGSLGTMAKKSVKPQGAPLSEIYSKRQPQRPHYLARLMALRNVTRGDLVRDLNVDKSQLSRWLDDRNPSTPGRDWSQRLGEYFSVPPDHDFVDIFADPDVDWMYRLLRGRSAEERDRIRATLEAAFPAKKRG